MNRRGFLFGLTAFAAPAIIRTPGLLMPVRSLRANFLLDPQFIMREMLAMVRRDEDALLQQLWADQVVFGTYATRTTVEPPFIERVDPLEFLSHDQLVTFNA